MNEIDAIVFETEDVEHVVANEDFDDHTRPYHSTLFGTIHLYADDEEITHSNYLPAKYDLVDTVRAQYELVEAVEANGEYRDVPFCCVCSVRSCAYVQWDVTTTESSDLRVRLETLLDDPIGDPPYLLSRDALYAEIHRLCEEVVEFCETNGIETFDWATWQETPVAGREHYATLDELRDYRDELGGLIRA